MIMQGKEPGKRLSKLRAAAVAAMSLVAFVALQGRPASAQLSWDWGGDETVGGSGRKVIAFNPKYSAGQVIVSFGDRRLYLITKPGEAISYPIAVPREKSRWEGVTSVTQKRVNPSWTPTPTMIAENPRLPRWVPGGHPYNPLGIRALYLGTSAYRIHGTDAPWTIGTAASKGCIRLFNQDVLDLYPRVPIGAKVTVTYQTFTTDGGAVSSVSTGSSKSFNLFGGDDAAPVKPAVSKRGTPKSKSAATAKSAAADHDKTIETQHASVNKVETAAAPEGSAAPVAAAPAAEPQSAPAE